MDPTRVTREQSTPLEFIDLCRRGTKHPYDPRTVSPFTSFKRRCTVAPLYRPRETNKEWKLEPICFDEGQPIPKRGRTVHFAETVSYNYFEIDDLKEAEKVDGTSTVVHAQADPQRPSAEDSVPKSVGCGQQRPENFFSHFSYNPTNYFTRTPKQESASCNVDPRTGPTNSSPTRNVATVMQFYTRVTKSTQTTDAELSCKQSPCSEQVAANVAASKVDPVLPSAAPPVPSSENSRQPNVNINQQATNKLSEDERKRIKYANRRMKRRQAKERKLKMNTTLSMQPRVNAAVNVCAQATPNLNHVPPRVNTAVNVCTQVTPNMNRGHVPPRVNTAVNVCTQATPNLHHVPPRVNAAVNVCTQATPNLKHVSPRVNAAVNICAQATPNLKHVSPRVNAAVNVCTQATPNLKHVSPRVNAAVNICAQATPNLNHVSSRVNAAVNVCKQATPNLKHVPPRVNAAVNVCKQATPNLKHVPPRVNAAVNVCAQATPNINRGHVPPRVNTAVNVCTQATPNMNRGHVRPQYMNFESNSYQNWPENPPHFRYPLLGMPHGQF